MSTRSMAYGWVVVVTVAVVLVGVVAALAFPRGRQRLAHARWVANAAFLASLGSVRRALATRRALLVLSASCLAVSTIAFSVVAGRPITTTVSNPRLATRDIVLCLDVSGSMVGYDTEIIDRFLDLMDQFQGERVSLSIWNQTSRTVFPLTDDYELVRDQLTIGRDAVDIPRSAVDSGMVTLAQLSAYEDFTAGTIIDEYAEQGSLVGDGLASCALLFEGSDSDRSHTIILATDNVVIGEPTISLRDAADFAVAGGTSLVGIFAGEDTEGSQAEMERVLTGVGGDFYVASDPDAVPRIVDTISERQTAELAGAPEVRITDRPTAAATVGVLALLAAFGLAWGARE